MMKGLYLTGHLLSLSHHQLNPPPISLKKISLMKGSYLTGMIYDTEQ